MGCAKCGGTETRSIELTKDGVVEATFESCAECLAESIEGARLLRLEFEGLLAAGVSREEANLILIDKIDQQYHADKISKRWGRA